MHQAVVQWLGALVAAGVGEGQVLTWRWGVLACSLRARECSDSWQGSVSIIGSSMTAPIDSPGQAAKVPEKPSLEGLEERWSERWEEDGVYRFDPEAPADRVYSIDTPPPTVSGSLHVGHVFSYTHT